MATIPATEFKAKCLELMDRVAEGRETYVITKHGKPVARLVPPDPTKRKSSFGWMADRMAFVDDEKAPWSEAEWKEFERQRTEQMRAWDLEWGRLGTISGRRGVGAAPKRGKTKPRRTSASRRSNR